MANCPECGVNLEVNPHRPGSGCNDKVRKFFQAKKSAVSDRFLWVGSNDSGSGYITVYEVDTGESRVRRIERSEKKLEARTYKYRDAEKRREYMREYMRKRRHACNDGAQGRES